MPVRVQYRLRATGPENKPFEWLVDTGEHKLISYHTREEVDTFILTLRSMPMAKLGTVTIQNNGANRAQVNQILEYFELVLDAWDKYLKHCEPRDGFGTFGTSKGE